MFYYLKKDLQGTFGEDLCKANQWSGDSIS